MLQLEDMASSSSLLSEEQFLCSICLDVFTEPVAIPCGHNFCLVCIRKYWDTTDLCHCPLCNKTFDRRPELFVNTFISEMAAQFKKSVQVKATSSPDQNPTNGEVTCDVCTGNKLKALKSCLECVTSYCETHLQPHQIAPALKRHRLIDPIENMEDRMCKKHVKPLELFCRTDQTCVCVLCIKTSHRTHYTVPFEEEFEAKMANLGKTQAQVQQRICERLKKVKDVKQSLELSRKDTEEEIAHSVQVFTVLVRSIERIQAEFIKAIEVKQKAAERRAEGLIQELEQELTELQRKSTELEQLSHTEDHLQFLQSAPSLCSLQPDRNWPNMGVQGGQIVGSLRRAVSQLEDTLTMEVKKLSDAELKRIQSYAVDVILDPDTANSHLILSKDRKQVKQGNTQNLPDNPKRFDITAILGQEGFSSGRFYYEVQVNGITWDLGVCQESINRKSEICLKPENGFWTVILRNGNEYQANGHISVPLLLKAKPRKVGVFVDYEEGQVSFYNVEDRSHIYSFTDYTFNKKLYPYFSPHLTSRGRSSVPLIISPVNHT
ncbi:hypothetical protein UPYG_G00280070 [Umbra pygmaea]|uniref:E3 ubiquitin-protein ligase TRIM39-like n=1 Tax=Umbra pygmaea TaxID=75934 RepID=A0ABD0W7L3_UMBPY